jgi:hypothetical protein
MVNLTYKIPTKEVIGMKRLPIILLIVTMLLAGCIGAKRPVYDGSPTALNVVIKRDTATVSALVESESEPETVKVRIWKTNEQGQVIYSVMRDVPLEEIESVEEGYTLMETVPANKGYTVTAVYAGQSTLETDTRTVDAPADAVTTINLSLSPINAVFHKPDVAFSGGSSTQFWVEFLELGDYLTYEVYLATTPWLENGLKSSVESPGPGWEGRTDTWYNWFFQEIDKPGRIYYQYHVVSTHPNLFGNISIYYPDLTTETELPYIEYYPSPDWID